MSVRRLSSLLFLTCALAHAAACRDRRAPTSPTVPESSTSTLASLTVSPGEVNGGAAVVGTATLTGPAPAAGATVTLTSNNSAASVPASVAVPPGATTAAFAVTTAVVTTATDVAITGASGGVQRVASLRIDVSSIPSQPGGPIASFGTLHDDVIGGDNTQGTITLDRPAPAGGITIHLSSDDAVVEVPAAVTIPAGAASATFKVGTLPVAAERAVTLTASVNPASGASEAALTIRFTLRVVPAVPSLTAIAPAQGVQGTSVSLVLTGTSLWSGATIAVSGGDVTASNVVARSQTAMTATLTIGASAAIGARSVTVTTAGGTSGVQTFTVTPSNSAPAADNDSFTVAEDTVLNVAAPGVLDGDTDPDGKALTSVLVTNVSNGTLVLNANGSFQYTPNENFNGSDSFTYRATDGAANSNTAMVRLTIDAVVDEQVFVFTGGAQNFTVPNGVTFITIEAHGAQGGTMRDESVGGNGGMITATLAVGPGAILQAGQVLQVFVGGEGAPAGGSPAAGGFNGGGSARSGVGPAATGGGASDLRANAFGLGDRLIVAGGGGGAGGRSTVGSGGSGGAGGATVGATGSAGSGASDSTMPGTGGTQTAGGTSPWPSGGGALGIGGAGGGQNTFSAQGGGGGGGFYGGGGGAPAGNTLSFIPGAAGGGGGGSSFAHASATNVTHVQGNRTGNGIVIIRW